VADSDSIYGKSSTRAGAIRTELASKLTLAVLVRTIKLLRPQGQRNQMEMNIAGLSFVVDKRDDERGIKATTTREEEEIIADFESRPACDDDMMRGMMR
jgi:hypothetical protein